MIEISAYSFWIYALIFALSLVSTVLLSRLLSPRAPNPVKHSIYECGQAPMGRARDFMIAGANRYYAYAVAFFALDAFSWILLTSVLAAVKPTSPIGAALVGIYVFVVLGGLVYFLKSLGRVLGR